jgi:cell division protein ZapA (FtsZ GTPase activity inhibitor)
MSEKNRVTLTIKGVKYTVVGDESQEVLDRIAAQSVQRIEEKLQGNQRINDRMAMLLSVFEAENELVNLHHEMENAVVDQALVEVDETVADPAVVDELKEKIRTKNDALLKAENTIHELQNKLFHTQIELVQARKKNEELGK